MIAWLQTTTPFKKITVVATCITAVVAAVIAVANAANLAEPYWIATRGFVTQQIAAQANPIVNRLITMQLFSARDTKRRTEQQIADKELLLKQNNGMPQAVKDAINEQIRSLQEQLQSANDAIADLARQQQSHQ